MYAVAYGAAQQDFGTLPPTIPPNRDIGNTTGFRLPRIDERTKEHLEASCSLKSGLQLSYQQTKAERGTFTIIPLGVLENVTSFSLHNLYHYVFYVKIKTKEKEKILLFF